ncbi:hypothetical protein ACFX13_030360 [Malus domestica]
MPSFEELTPFPDVNLMNKIDHVDLIPFSLPSRDSQAQAKDLLPDSTSPSSTPLELTIHLLRISISCSSCSCPKTKS